MLKNTFSGDPAKASVPGDGGFTFGEKTIALFFFNDAL